MKLIKKLFSKKKKIISEEDLENPELKEEIFKTISVEVNKLKESGSTKKAQILEKWLTETNKAEKIELEDFFE